MFEHFAAPPWLADLPILPEQMTLSRSPQIQSRINNLLETALAANKAKDYQQALEILRQVVRINPFIESAYCLMGEVFYQLNDYDAAEKAYRRALSLNMQYERALIHFGNLLNHLNRYPEAEDIFLRVLEQHPESPAARVNYGLTLLNQGKLTQGWPYYDLRIDFYDRVVGINDKIPEDGQRWQGESITDKIILVWSEQGLGDEILCARFLHSLSRMRPRQIVLATGIELLDLFQHLTGSISQLLVLSQPQYWKLPTAARQKVDYWTGMLSLPRYCADAAAANGLGNVNNNPHNSVNSVTSGNSGYSGNLVNSGNAANSANPANSINPINPNIAVNSAYAAHTAQTPYLSADPHKKQHWQHKLHTGTSTLHGSIFAPHKSLTVGLVWRGQTQNPIGMYRSLPNGLNDLAPLWRVEHVRFVSLQMEIDEADRQAMKSLSIDDFMSEIKTMDDTAALVANLDLVITVDTSIGHLAGALGIPCWVMLSGWGMEWRHFDQSGQHKGSDSLWYPQTHQFFRGHKAAWPNVIDAVMRQLARRVGGKQTEVRASPPLPSGIYATTQLPAAYRHAENLMQSGNLLACFDYGKKQLAAAPTDLPLIRLVSDAIYTLEDLATAESWLNYELSLDPNNVVRMIRLARVYQGQNRNDKAIQLLQYALNLAPENENVRLCLAEHLLSGGYYHQGWAHYLIRHDLTFLPRIPFPKWRGEPLKGKSLFLSTEQGLGDEIQFIRLLPLLKKAGVSRITVMCKEPLVPLFQRVSAIDEVHPFKSGVILNMHDFWSFPLDLPHYLAITLENLPNSTPYLSVDTQRVQFWAEKLPTATIRIGLVWKGNPQHSNDIRRSLKHFSELRPLWAVQQQHQIAFISLQKGDACAEINPPPDDQPITEIGSQLNDFDDTAAVIAQLDLVICVDTSVAHLAGALHKPCWMMMPSFEYDWRWGEESKSCGVTPWYPSMRIFRKPPATVWTQTVERVAAALADFLQPPEPADNLTPDISIYQQLLSSADDVAQKNAALQKVRQAFIEQANCGYYAKAAQMCLLIINETRQQANFDPVEFLNLSYLFASIDQTRAAVDTSSEYQRLTGTAPEHQRRYALALTAQFDYGSAKPLLTAAYQLHSQDIQVLDALAEISYFYDADTAESLAYARQSRTIKQQRYPALNRSNQHNQHTQHTKQRTTFLPQHRANHVIALSINDDTQQPAAEEMILAARYLLPEWRCRFYCAPQLSTACRLALLQKGASVVVMPQDSVPALWNLSVAFDPLVDFFLLRTLDRPLTTQDAAHIAQWLDGNKLFLVDRYCPYRGDLCLVDAWGGVGHQLPQLAQQSQNFAQSRLLTPEALRHFHNAVLWPQIAGSVHVVDPWFMVQSPASDNN